MRLSAWPPPAQGPAKRGGGGKADSELIDARDIVAFGARWMTEHLGSAIL